MSEPYLQDDGRTLRNKLGIERNPQELAKREAIYVARRILELRLNGLPHAHGFELVKATHRYLFQDVYSWAGLVRSTVLAREDYEGGHHHYFLAPARIESVGKRIFEDLAAQNDLTGLGRSQFADALSGYFNRLNEVHPFREGNGRTQRIVWQHIAREAGHDLSFRGISKERMVAVSTAASQGDVAPVRRMFEELLDPERARALREATRFFEEHRSKDFEWHDRYVATTAPGQSYKGTFVSSNNDHFIMHDGQRIFIGKKLDLPNAGADLARGDKLEFTSMNRPNETDQRALDPAREPLPESQTVDIEQIKAQGRATIQGWNRELEREKEIERQNDLDRSSNRGRGGPDEDLEK